MDADEVGLSPLMLITVRQPMDALKTRVRMDFNTRNICLVHIIY